MRKVLLLVLVFLLILGLSEVRAQGVGGLPDPLDREVGSLVSLLSDLESKHVNVTNLVISLDRAVKLYEKGDKEGALKIISEVKAKASELEQNSSRVYLRYVTRKAIYVATLASFPILVYVLLPRIVAYLWYKYRKGWRVVRK